MNFLALGRSAWGSSYTPGSSSVHLTPYSTYTRKQAKSYRLHDQNVPQAAQSSSKSSYLHPLQPAICFTLLYLVLSTPTQQPPNTSLKTFRPSTSSYPKHIGFNMPKTDLSNCSSFSCRFDNSALGSSVPFRDGSFRMYGHGAVFVGHYVVVIGGYYSLQKITQLYLYDTIGRVWSARAVGNSGHLYGQIKLCFILEDKLFVFLWSGSRVESFLWEGDFVLQSNWQKVDRGSSFPTRDRSTIGAYHEWKNQVVFYGDKGVFVLDLNTRKVKHPETKGVAPKIGINQSCCASRTAAYFTSRNQGLLVLNELNLGTLTWSTVFGNAGMVPPMRAYFSLSYVSGRIFAFGGYSSSERLDVYIIQETRWKSIVPRGSGSNALRLKGSMDGGTRMHATVHTSDKLIVFGGFGTAFTMLQPLVIRPG